MTVQMRISLQYVYCTYSTTAEFEVVITGYRRDRGNEEWFNKW